jgi:ParB/RepB/Spo0J family partition protein
MSTDEVIIQIPLDELVDSPFQPRTTYNQASLEELALTMKPPTGRVQQPIVVRVVGDKNEIVFGHRRTRGARLAQLQTIPAIVREMTDQEVKLAQIVENLQREGVSAVDEAEAMHLLRVEHKASIEDLMAQSGKSRTYVYNRLRLSDAIEEVRHAVRHGDTEAEVAQEIARRPRVLQLKALRDVGQMSYRAAKEHLDRHYQFKLSSAPFSLLSAKLLPEAGACDTCPKRSDAEPVLLEECGPGICMDGECYGKKAVINREIEAKKLRKQQDSAPPAPAPPAWPFPQRASMATVSQAAESESDAEDGDEHPVQYGSPEEAAVMNDERWGQIRQAMLRATLSRPRTTDDLRLLLEREMDLGDSDFGEAEEVLNWSLDKGKGSAERRVAQLAQMTADQLGALLMMVAILTGPLTRTRDESRAQARIRMAQHFGIDVLTGLQTPAQPSTNHERDPNTPDMFDGTPTPEAASTPPSAARAPKKAKAAAGAKKAKPLAKASKEQWEEQTDDAGVAGGSDANAAALEVTEE